TESAIKKMQDEASKGNMQLVHSKGNNDVDLIMINMTKAPVDDIRVRQAMAYAIDPKPLNDITNTDPLLNATSAFQPDSKWYSPQPNYPHFDLDKAKALIADYAKDHGPVHIDFATNPDNEVLQVTQAIASMWQAAGIETSIKTFDQPTLIGNAVTGNYQI